MIAKGVVVSLDTRQQLVSRDDRLHNNLVVSDGSAKVC